MQMLYFRATLSMEIIMNNHVISKYPREHKHFVSVTAGLQNKDEMNECVS